MLLLSAILVRSIGPVEKGGQVITVSDTESPHSDPPENGGRVSLDIDLAAPEGGCCKIIGNVGRSTDQRAQQAPERRCRHIPRKVPRGEILPRPKSLAALENSSVRTDQIGHTAACQGRWRKGIARNSCDLLHSGTKFCAIRNATNGAVVHGKPGTVRGFPSADAEWHRGRLAVLNDSGPFLTMAASARRLQSERSDWMSIPQLSIVATIRYRRPPRSRIAQRAGETSRLGGFQGRIDPGRLVRHGRRRKQSVGANCGAAQNACSRAGRGAFDRNPAAPWISVRRPDHDEFTPQRDR